MTFGAVRLPVDSLAGTIGISEPEHGMKRRVVGLVPFLMFSIACGKDSTGTNGETVAAVNVVAVPDSLGQGDRLQVAATVRMSSGNVLRAPAVAWSSSDTAVATISVSGLVTGVRDGSVTIRATFENVSGSASVKVKTILRNVIIFTTEESGLPTLAVVHPDGTGRRRVTTNQQPKAAPAISPDGKRIAFAGMVSGAWGIYVMKADGTGSSLLIQRSSFDGSPAWSPDGSRIAFRSENNGPYGPYGRIFVINTDGTGIRQVSPETGNYTYDDGPAWSPDGSRIAFSRSGKLHVINADGTGFTPLPNDEGAEYPSWSPDGTRLAFASSGTLDIYVRNADGSNPVRLTTAPEQEDLPRWSPDSRQLVFDRVVQGVQLFIINADGTGEVRLSTMGTNSDGWASWSPAR